MDDLFHKFSAAAFSLLTIVTLHSHHITTDIKHNSADTHNQHVAMQQILAKGSVSRFGQTVDITLRFPKNGGAVAGEITGACTGTIQGTFDKDGNSKGEINGNARADCPFLLTTIEGSAKFHGKVDLENKSISLDAVISAKGINQDISLHLITN